MKHEGMPQPLPDKLPERIGQPASSPDGRPAPSPGAEPKSPESKQDIEGLIVTIATRGRMLAKEVNQFKDLMAKLDITKTDEKLLHDEIAKEANRVYNLVLDSHLKVKKLLETLPPEEQKLLQEKVKNASEGANIA